MIKIKKIIPMFTALVTTMDRYERDQTTKGGLIDTSKREGSLKEYQKVITIGESVRSIKPGDLVCINPQRFAIKQHQAGSLKDGIIGDNPIIKYNFDTIEINGEQCLLLQDRDIDFIIKEYDDV
jgi:hypothetical protein